MSSHDRGGGCLTAIAVVASILVFAGGAILLYLIATNSSLLRPQSAPLEQEELSPKSFAEYSWEELSEISQLISSASSDEEGREVASVWGVGIGDTRTVSLTDGRQATATVVGIRADDLADGSGAAGITFIASDGVSVRRSARRGCSREPHTGQGFPASKVSARIPACSSRKALFSSR